MVTTFYQRTRCRSLSLYSHFRFELATGYSISKDTIDGYQGYWVRISLDDNAEKSWSPKNGWVFSRFVNVNKSIGVSTISLEKVNLQKGNTFLSLTLAIHRNQKKQLVNVIPHKMSKQEFYTFTWSDDEAGFYYSDPTGTFTWDPKTKKVQHISYLGYGLESGWCSVTDDFQYLLQDFGTSPGPRGLEIFDVKTNELIYSGTYYQDLEYDGRSIKVVEVYDSWNVKNKYISEDSIKLAIDYISKTKMPESYKKWKEEGGSVDVIVCYRYNFERRSKSFLNCQYITT